MTKSQLLTAVSYVILPSPQNATHKADIDNLQGLLGSRALLPEFDRMSDIMCVLCGSAVLCWAKNSSRLINIIIKRRLLMKTTTTADCSPVVLTWNCFFLANNVRTKSISVPTRFLYKMALQKGILYFACIVCNGEKKRDKLSHSGEADSRDKFLPWGKSTSYFLLFLRRNTARSHSLLQRRTKTCVSY